MRGAVPVHVPVRFFNSRARVRLTEHARGHVHEECFTVPISTVTPVHAEYATTLHDPVY